MAQSAGFCQLERNWLAGEPTTPLQERRPEDQDTKASASRKQARADVFDYIEFFYNPKRKHGNKGMLSPIDFEQQQNWKTQSV